MKEKMTMVTDQYGQGTDLIFEPELSTTTEPVVEASPPPSSQQAPIEEPQEQEVVPEQPVRETKNSPNFRTLKAEAARIAKERDEMKAQLEQLQKMQMYHAPVPQPQPAVNTDFDIDPDAYAEGKHIKSIANQMKEMKQEVERSRREMQQMAIRNKLISEYPDYERVMTTENLNALQATKPHFAKAINFDDPYNSGKACYELIKDLGIDNDDASESEVTKAMIAQNLAKPKPAAAVKGARPTNETAMGRASEFYKGELNDQAKKQFYKEMQDAIGSYGGYKP